MMGHLEVLLPGKVWKSHVSSEISCLISLASKKHILVSFYFGVGRFGRYLEDVMAPTEHALYQVLVKEICIGGNLKNISS